VAPFDVICQRRPDLVGRAAVNAERYVANQSYVQMTVLNGLGSAALSGDESHGDDDEYLMRPLPDAVSARGLVQAWIATKFEEASDPWWLTDFIALNVKPSVVTLALAYEFDEDKSKYLRKHNRRKEKKRAREEANTATIKTKREKTKQGSLKRVPWMAEETKALCDGIIQYSGGKWASIAHLSGLEQRANTHCKDRMRVLMRQYGSDDIVATAEKWIKDHYQDHHGSMASDDGEGSE
jgi:hypothetical protein